MTASSVVAAPSRRTPEGPARCDPNHSSASGPGDGVGRPWISAIAIVEPQA